MLEFILAIVVSLITGTISLLAFYHSFSKNIVDFYNASSETIDLTGIFLLVGLLGKLLHRIYKKVFPKHHFTVLRITTFLYGILFLIIAVGVWFIDLKPFVKLG